AAIRWVTERLRGLPRRVDVLLATLGTEARVDLAAQRLGLTGRTLRRHTARIFGLGPAELQRLLRFERACALLRQPGSLTDVAHTAGYADHAHFTREFRRFTGQTPSAVRAVRPATASDWHLHPR